MFLRRGKFTRSYNSILNLSRYLPVRPLCGLLRDIALDKIKKLLFQELYETCHRVAARGGGVLPIMAYTGRLRPKGVPFSGFRYIKG